MPITICGWCGRPKKEHTINGWNYCQSKINRSNSTGYRGGGIS